MPHQVSNPIGTNRLWLIKHPIQWVPVIKRPIQREPICCGSPSILSNVNQSVVPHQVSNPIGTNRLWLIKHPIQWVPVIKRPIQRVPVVAHKVSYPMDKGRFWLTKYPIQWVPIRCSAASIPSKEYQPIVAHYSSCNGCQQLIAQMSSGRTVKLYVLLSLESKLGMRGARSYLYRPILLMARSFSAETRYVLNWGGGGSF